MRVIWMGVRAVRLGRIVCGVCKERHDRHMRGRSAVVWTEIMMMVTGFVRKKASQGKELAFKEEA